VLEGKNKRETSGLNEADWDPQNGLEEPHIFEGILNQRRPVINNAGKQGREQSITAEMTRRGSPSTKAARKLRKAFFGEERGGGSSW